MVSYVEDVIASGCDVLLINPPYPRRHGGGLVPPIGLCYLAACLREAGANPKILDLVAVLPDYDFSNSEAPIEIVRSLLRELRRNPPTLIGVGPLVTATLRSTRDIIQVCREEVSSTIVVGGPLCSVPGISLATKEYLGVDAFVAGDGEAPLAGIWRVLNGTCLNRNIPGVGFSGADEPAPFREHNLDSLPIPARDLLPSDDYISSARRDIGYGRMTAAFLSRGCPYSCSFCAAPLSSGKVIRRLSAGRITQEVSACGRAGFTSIIFYDDCLFVKSSKLNAEVFEFTEAIKAADWEGTFQLELRCDAVVALSDDALRSLVEVGCRQINMGIEKGHIAQLQQLRKKLSPQVALEACQKIANSGIRAAGTFILGGPGETIEELDATIDFATSLPLHFAHFNPMAIYPGTSLYNQEFGVQKPGEWLKLCLNHEIAPLGDILWRSADVPLDAILAAVKDGYGRFYDQTRLERILEKLPESERHGVQESYQVLAHDRARSWADKGYHDSPVAQLLSC
jgi:anaerobic magnesium-protoporphyrin IX monomethyl ester cyclase